MYYYMDASNDGTEHIFISKNAVNIIVDGLKGLEAHLRGISERLGQFQGIAMFVKPYTESYRPLSPSVAEDTFPAESVKRSRLNKRCATTRALPTTSFGSAIACS